MRRVFPWLICSISVLTVGACSASGDIGHVVDHAPQVYRDLAGWSVAAPHGWHIVRFSESKRGVVSTGVQISSVRLSAPTLVVGYPIQVQDRVLPARGVGLIIARDTEAGLSHGTVAVPPLPSPTRWLKGSRLAGLPYMETRWFRANGRLFIANAEVGAKASGADLTALAWVIKSVRVSRAPVMHSYPYPGIPQLARSDCGPPVLGRLQSPATRSASLMCGRP